MGGNINQRIYVIILILFSQLALPAQENSSEASLDKILKEKSIRFITTPSAFDYYIYQGQHKGYQYELAKLFVNYLNNKYLKNDPVKIRFEMIPLSFVDMIDALNASKGDVISANLTITNERLKKVAFTDEIRSSQEIIVTRNELKNSTIWHKRIAVRKGTSFFEHIYNWNKNNPESFLAVDYVDKSLEIENTLELLAYGKYDYAMTDSHIFELTQNIHPSLVKANQQPFKKITKIAWATRIKDIKLREEINNFIPKIKEGSLLGNIFHRRYFEDLEVISDARNTNKISAYDELIKKYSKKYQVDWRLMSALAFQESRFKAHINNKWGAIGLFQIKKSTASEPYVNIKKIKGVQNVENNIHAGIKYFAWIRDTFFNKMNEKEKINFTLAAYNAGPGALKRARKKAKKMKLNPNKWKKNTEFALINLNKLEPVKYVSEIRKRYKSYKLMGY